MSEWSVLTQRRDRRGSVEALRNCLEELYPIVADEESGGVSRD
jgi:hypothetical protein